MKLSKLRTYTTVWKHLGLQKKDWIDAGWILMANRGFAGVKVEVLARELKVSKGSFYWHFKNRQELLEEILQRWEEETNWVITESQKASTPKECLVRLFTLAEEMYSQPIPDPEPAIYLWANQDPAVQERVYIVENRRITLITKLLQNYGFTPSEARHKAEVGYFALMGFWERSERDKKFDLSMQEFNEFLLALLLTPVNQKIDQANK